MLADETRGEPNGQSRYVTPDTQVSNDDGTVTTLGWWPAGRAWLRGYQPRQSGRSPRLGRFPEFPLPLFPLR